MIKKLIRKFKSKTPVIWKNIQRLIIAIGSLATATILAPETFSVLPPWVNKAVMICSVVGAVIIQFAGKEDNEDEKVEVDNKCDCPS